MGQNIAGQIEMKINAPKGARIFTEHCEILQEGNFYNGNLGRGIAQFGYISNGEEQNQNYKYDEFYDKNRLINILLFHNKNVI